MLWDVITNPWLWASAAVIFVVLFGVFFAANFRRSKPQDEIHDKQNGWTPTGRIDFLDPNETGTFILQAEITRIVTSMGGMEHREIHWRKATLNEAKRVVVAYHAQLNLATAAAFDVNSSNSDTMKSSPMNEHQNAPYENGAAE
jgi:hypothetical protein